MNIFPFEYRVTVAPSFPWSILPPSLSENLTSSIGVFLIISIMSEILNAMIFFCPEVFVLCLCYYFCLVNEFYLLLFIFSVPH